MQENPVVPNVDTEAILAAIREFEAEAKTGRVFFRDHPAFAMKCESYLEAITPFVKGRDADGIHVVDKSTYRGNESPVTWTFGQDDVIAIIDSTKVRLFGNIFKQPCKDGLLVTTKGLMAFRLRDGTPYYSGFLSWKTIANCTEMGGSAVDYGVRLFVSMHSHKGATIYFWLPDVKDKKIGVKLEKLACHLRFIVENRQGDFDYDEYAPEESFESDD